MMNWLYLLLGFVIAAQVLAAPGGLEHQALHQIAPTLYADPAYTASKHASLIASMNKAKFLLTQFFGAQHATDPDVIFCKTQACAAYYAGSSQRGKALKTGQTGVGAQYKATQPTIVIVKQGRYGQAQLAHELVHVEVNARTGNRLMPSWFHEGLATLVSGQPECAHEQHIDKQGINHLVAMQAQRLDWATYTNDPARSRASYCQAAHEVNLWIGQHRKPALIRLLDEVKAGKRFDALYGARLTTSGS